MQPSPPRRVFALLREVSLQSLLHAPRFEDEVVVTTQLLECSGLLGIRPVGEDKLARIFQVGDTAAEVQATLRAAVKEGVRVLKSKDDELLSGRSNYSEEGIIFHGDSFTLRLWSSLVKSKRGIIEKNVGLLLAEMW